MDTFYGRGIEYVSAASLIEDLLGFEPVALAGLAPAGDHKNDRALLGLKEFLRRTYALAFAIRDKAALSLQILTDADARTLGWPDACVGNLATLFAWAMVREFRWYKSLPFLTLEPHRADGALPSKVDDTFADLSFAELVQKLSQFAELKESATRSHTRSRSSRWPQSISGSSPCISARVFARTRRTCPSILLRVPMDALRLGWSKRSMMQSASFT